MPTETRIIPRETRSKQKGVPTVIRWQNEKMVASHSIRSVAKEIINMSAAQDFVSINLIGKQGTGKTELMRTLAHLIHDGAKIPYNINYFGKNEMLNLEETVTSLTPTNQIILFDDIAFLKASATNKQIDQIQQVLSVIRHLPSGEDVKIILMKSFQYTKSINPFLRQNDATFVSSVDDNEVDNLQDLLGKKYFQKINLLKNLRVQSKLGDKFVYPLGTKGKSLVYKARNPFLPFLYSNQISCRIVVSPLREWIQSICHVCSPVKKQDSVAKQNLEEFIADFCKKFGSRSNAKTAVKIKLIQQGLNCYPKRIVQAVNYIDRYLAKKVFNLEELAVAFDLEPTKTLLQPSKQPEIEE